MDDTNGPVPNDTMHNTITRDNDDLDSFASEDINLPDSSDNDSENCYLNMDSDQDIMEPVDIPPRPASPGLVSPILQSPLDDISQSVTSPRDSMINMSTIGEHEYLDTTSDKINSAQALVHSQERLLRDLREMHHGLSLLQGDLDTLQSEFTGPFQARRILQLLQQERNVCQSVVSYTAKASRSSSNLSGQVSRPSSGMSGRYTPTTRPQHSARPQQSARPQYSARP